MFRRGSPSPHRDLNYPPPEPTLNLPAFRGKQPLRRRNIALSALDPLAGVLLGKTSVNSLYGLQDGLLQTVPQFWRS
jgi:hypothetical protein